MSALRVCELQRQCGDGQSTMTDHVIGTGDFCCACVYVCIYVCMHERLMVCAMWLHMYLVSMLSSHVIVSKLHVNA